MGPGTLRYLHCPLSVTQGSALDVSDLQNMVLQLTGTWTATLQLQKSYDGVTWYNEGAAQSSNGALAISGVGAFVRLDVTAFTSGTPFAVIYGTTP